MPWVIQEMAYEEMAGLLPERTAEVKPHIIYSLYDILFGVEINRILI